MGNKMVLSKALVKDVTGTAVEIAKEAIVYVLTETHVIPTITDDRVSCQRRACVYEYE